MSTTTLRAYLDELDLLLQREALEEVIGHCRHILQHYPKNIETYRLLGKALLEKARYEEAAQVFPRLLSADPNDFVAHVGMSAIYENQQQGNQAIWHMERAYEQMPNNNVILNELKRLHKRRDEVAPRKIQMTRAALAQQYLSSGMFEQAITELRRGLVEQPNRLDLRVRLANALWDAGHLLEGGEAALEVLRILPDCLPLNLLMAKLWIESRRPDDAKPFLEKVEALAPYESLRLIYKTDNEASLPEGAFVLTRLKWTADAATSVAGPTPDWLSQITDVFDVPASAPARSGKAAPPQDLPDWMTEATAATTASEDLPDWFTPGADFGSKPKTGGLPSPDDWFAEMTTELSQSAPPAAIPAMPTSSAEDELPDWFSNVSEVGTTAPAGDLFGSPAGDDLTPDWFSEDIQTEPAGDVAPTSGWLIDMPDFSADEPAPPARKSTGFTGLLAEIQTAEEQPDEEIVPDWLGNVGMGAIEEDEPPSIFGDIDEFSFAEENADEELEKLRAAARPPSAEEVASLLALGGRKPEEVENELAADWLSNESAFNFGEAAPSTEDSSFENFGSFETESSFEADWLFDAPTTTEPAPVSDFGGLFGQEEASTETADWLTDFSSTEQPVTFGEEDEPADIFGSDDWLTADSEISETPAAEFTTFDLEPADDNADWLSDAVSTEPASLTLENVGQESVQEFASLFDDESVAPITTEPSAKRLGVTGELPWMQGVSESSSTDTVDEFATLFDSQLPEQMATTPSRLGVTGELPWRQDLGDDDPLSPTRHSSLDAVDWDAVGSTSVEEEIEPEGGFTLLVDDDEEVPTAAPVDELSSWLNVTPQTSSIAQDVSDEEFGDLFGSDLIPGTAWLDDVQQDPMGFMSELSSEEGEEELPDWMQGMESIEPVSSQVTDDELGSMFADNSPDSFSNIGAPGTGWLMELPSTETAPVEEEAADWLTAFDEPSTTHAVAQQDLTTEISDDWLSNEPTTLSSSLASEISDDDLSSFLGDDFSNITEPRTGWLDDVSFDEQPETASDWLSSFGQAEPPAAIPSTQTSDTEFGNLFDDFSEVSLPQTGWLSETADDEQAAPQDSGDWLTSFGQDESLTDLPSSQISSPEFGSLFDDLSEIETPRTGWLDDVSAETLEPENAADWLSAFGEDEPPSIPSAQASDTGFDSLFDDFSEISTPQTGWLADVSLDEQAEPENAADWLTSFGQDEPPTPIPAAEAAEGLPDWLDAADMDFGDVGQNQLGNTANLFDSFAETQTPRTGWLDDVNLEQAEPESAADWLTSFGQDEPPAAMPAAKATDGLPSWLADDDEMDFGGTPQAQLTDTGFDNLFDDLSAAETPSTGWLEEAESNDEEDWLSTIGKSDPTAPIPASEPAAALPDWLAGVEIEEEPESTPVTGFDDLFEDMASEEDGGSGDWSEPTEDIDWTGGEAEELAEPAGNEVPDWLSDDIRLDTSSNEPMADFEERLPRGATRESQERVERIDNIDAFLASVAGSGRQDQTEAMISELDELTGFKIRELTAEEVASATRPSSAMPSTLPEDFPDEADFGFGKEETSRVAAQTKFSDTDIPSSDDFDDFPSEVIPEESKRGRRLFGKRKSAEPTPAVETTVQSAATNTSTVAVVSTASFDFDREPPWLRKTQAGSSSRQMPQQDQLESFDLDDDEDLPPDWFK